MTWTMKMLILVLITRYTKKSAFLGSNTMCYINAKVCENPFLIALEMRAIRFYTSCDTWSIGKREIFWVYINRIQLSYF